MKKKGFENRKNHSEMGSESLSFNELFPRFVAAKTAEGVSEKTVDTYHQHWKCIGKHLDVDLIRLADYNHAAEEVSFCRVPQDLPIINYSFNVSSCKKQ